MEKFRNSGIMRLVCLLMAVCIFGISCDPNGSLANDYRMDKEIDEQVKRMETKYSKDECTKARKMLTKAKAYLLANNANGLVSREGLLNYMIDKSIEDGTLPQISAGERKEVVERFVKDAYFLNDESLDPVYEKMRLEDRITMQERDFLVSFEDQLVAALNEAEVVEIFNAVRNQLPSTTSLTSEFKNALNLGMDQAELAMCAAGRDGRAEVDKSTNDRCQIEVCITEYKWVFAIINVVIAVVSIVLAIFTFGFSLLLTVVTFAAWVLVPVITCLFVDCPEPDCPDGQSFTCLSGFTLNSDNLCFAAGFSFVGDGIFSDPTSGTDCPPGTFYTGAMLGCAHGTIGSQAGGIFGDLVDGEDYWADGDGAYHRPVCN